MTANTPRARLLVISELFLPTKGGTAVWFDEVYRRLGGRDIHIVTADVPGAHEHDATHPNTVHRVSLRRHWWLRPESLVIYGKLCMKSLGLAMRYRPDAVHAGRVLPEGLVAWLVGRLTHRPVLVYAHGEEITSWRQAMKFRVMRFVFRRADRVIANSGFTRDELQKLGVEPDRISVIYPGVDIERFKPGLETDGLRAAVGIPEQAKLILSVGRLSRRKSFDQVIRALPILRSSGLDAHYAIVGIGEDKGYLQGLAAEQGVAEHVHLLGHVSMGDLPRWYNAADVFAMPNREINGDTEGFGMVFLEAAACGKPVVAGKAGGTGSSVVDGVTGYRVDGADPDAVAGALSSLCSDPERAAVMGTQALERARSAFSWSRVADLTARLIPSRAGW